MNVDPKHWSENIDKVCRFGVTRRSSEENSEIIENYNGTEGG
jgi:hypothetical protein